MRSGSTAATSATSRMPMNNGRWRICWCLRRRSDGLTLLAIRSLHRFDKKALFFPRVQSDDFREAADGVAEFQSRYFTEPGLAQKLFGKLVGERRFADVVPQHVSDEVPAE